ncbi:MAG: hypothetical protein ABI747_01505 [Candidatus Moraniibacteriota bacterium]
MMHEYPTASGDVVPIDDTSLQKQPVTAQEEKRRRYLIPAEAPAPKLVGQDNPDQGDGGNVVLSNN